MDGRAIVWLPRAEMHLVQGTNFHRAKSNTFREGDVFNFNDAQKVEPIIFFLKYVRKVGSIGNKSQPIVKKYKHFNYMINLNDKIIFISFVQCRYWAVHKLCHPKSGGSRPPLPGPPLSAIGNISPTPPPPFVCQCRQKHLICPIGDTSKKK